MARLDEMLGACLAVQKLYGRDTADAGTIIDLFQRMMSKYPAGKVIRAFEIWMERSQEFPTPADIVNLIKRNGKPPLSKERYIAIQKKDGEDRTPDDWQYIKEYEREQDREDYGSDMIDEIKETATMQENIRLRTELRELRSEYAKLSEMLKQERQQKTISAPQITKDDKITRTIQFMKDSGASEVDIEAFKASCM